MCTHALEQANLGKNINSEVNLTARATWALDLVPKRYHGSLWTIFRQHEAIFLSAHMWCGLLSVSFCLRSRSSHNTAYLEIRQHQQYSRELYVFTSLKFRRKLICSLPVSNSKYSALCICWSRMMISQYGALFLSSKVNQKLKMMRTKSMVKSVIQRIKCREIYSILTMRFHFSHPRCKDGWT